MPGPLTQPGDPTLVIACGALARELKVLIRTNQLSHLKLHCLPADLHNRPAQIPIEVERVVTTARAADRDARIFVAYADCGTGGRLDAVLARHEISRLPGAHCYELFAGSDAFAAMHEEEPGSFYLTDFLARHFDRLIMTQMGLSAHPELIAILFSNYQRVVFLDQAGDGDTLRQARWAAARLGLAFEHRMTSLRPLANQLAARVGHHRHIALQVQS